jgi:Icc protein
MKFIHLTDLHLSHPGRIVNGCNPSFQLEECFKDIETWHGDAAFCVISGDLAESAEEEAYQFLKDKIKKFKIPCFLMIGNHDDRSVFQRIFKNHPKDTHGFVQYLHETADKVFLFLDTTIGGKEEHRGQLCNDRLTWLKQNLTKAGNKKTYLFMHHPPFNIGLPYVDNIKLIDAEGFTEALATGQNICHIFFGHVHRMTYVNWRGFSFTSLSSVNHQIPLVAASVNAEYCREPPAYGVIHLSEDQMTVNFNTFLQRDPLIRS